MNPRKALLFYCDNVAGKQRPVMMNFCYSSLLLAFTSPIADRTTYGQRQTDCVTLPIRNDNTVYAHKGLMVNEQNDVDGWMQTHVFSLIFSSSARPAPLLSYLSYSCSVYRTG